jgi:hypothetical protein
MPMKLGDMEGRHWERESRPGSKARGDGPSAKPTIQTQTAKIGESPDHKRQRKKPVAKRVEREHENRLRTEAHYKRRGVKTGMKLYNAISSRQTIATLVRLRASRKRACSYSGNCLENSHEFLAITAIRLFIGYRYRVQCQ